MITNHGGCLPINVIVGPSEVQNLLNQIPREVLAQIFYHLRTEEISNISLSSQFWSCASVNYIKKYSLPLLNSFVGFLCENGQPKGIQLDWSVAEEDSLLEISDRMLKARDKLVDALKDLDRVSFRKMENLSKRIPKPIFFEKLFGIAKIMRTLNCDWRFKKGNPGNLGRAALELSFLGCSNKAFQFVNAIPDVEISYESWHYDGSKSAKFATFCLQIQQHSCNGLFDKIMEVAKSIVCQDHKFITFDDELDHLNSLKMICAELVKANKRERVDEVLNLIPCIHEKKTVLEKMNETDSSGLPLDRQQIIALQQCLENDCKVVSVSRFLEARH